MTMLAISAVAEDSDFVDITQDVDLTGDAAADKLCKPDVGDLVYAHMLSAIHFAYEPYHVLVYFLHNACHAHIFFESCINDCMVIPNGTRANTLYLEWTQASDVVIGNAGSRQIQENELSRTVIH